MLTFDTYPHPPKGNENQRVLFRAFGEPSTYFPTPSTPKALSTNFCQVKLEPSLPTPNHALRVRRNVVLDIFQESLTSTLKSARDMKRKEPPRSKKIYLHG